MAHRISLTATTPMEEKFSFAWMEYVEWGVQNPLESSVLGMLSVSDQIWEESHAVANALFPELLDLCGELEPPSDAALPDAFFVKSYFALAEIAVTMSADQPAHSDRYKSAGLRMLLAGLSPSP